MAEINQRPLKESTDANTRRHAAIANANVFEKETSINPQATSHNLLGASAHGAQAFMKISELGLDVAEASSNEMASIAGREAAQKPGHQLIPSFTKADKAFATAYIDERSSIVAFEGRKLINANMLEAMKNPTPESLDVFQKNMEQALQGLTSQESDILKGPLLRQLMNSYQTAYMQLAQQIQTKELKFLEKQDVADFDSQLKETGNQFRSGEVALGEESLSFSLNEIQKKLDAKLIDPVVAQKRIDALASTRLAGKYQFEYSQVEDKPGYMAWRANPALGNEFIDPVAGVIKRGEDGATPLQQDEANESLRQFNNQYNSMVKTQKGYVKGVQENLIQEGKYTSSMLDEYKQEATPEDYEDVRHKFWMHENKDGGNVTAQIDEVKGQVGLLAKYTPKQINKWFKEQQENLQATIANEEGQARPLTIEEEGGIVQQLGVPVPVFSDKLEAMVNFGSDENDMPTQQSVEAMREILRLSQINNGALVSDAWKRLGPMAVKFQSYDDGNPSNAIMALKRARDSMSHVNSLSKEALRIEYAKQGAAGGVGVDSSGKWSNPEVVKSYVAEAVGLTANDKTRPLVKPDQWMRYQDLHQLAFDQTGVWSQATKLANQQFSEEYGASVGNGSTEIMKASPEKNVPGADKPGGMIWVRNQFVESCQLIFDMQKDAFDTASAPFYFKFKEGQIKPVKNKMKDAMYPTSWWGDNPPIMAIRVSNGIDGALKEEEVQLRFESDSSTRSRNADNPDPTTYGFRYIDQYGRSNSIVWDGDAEGARFTPDEQWYREQPIEIEAPKETPKEAYQKMDELEFEFTKKRGNP